MRFKEYLICVIVFTILYVLFFVLYDKLIRKKEKGRVDKRLHLIMDGERFFRFAQFYGVNTRLSSDQLTSIYDRMRKSGDFVISLFAKDIQLTPYEVIVIVLYFEYFLLLEKKNISLESDLVKTLNVTDQGYLFKYGPMFLEKNSMEQILQKEGAIANKELIYMQENFLTPGIRLWDNTLYYVEGVDIDA